MSELRPIDISGMELVHPASQPAPQLQWIKIDDLVIDGRYQRPLAKGNVQAIKRIAAEFMWSRFSPVLVAPVAGGKFALIDGQHRAYAAALCGFESVPAMIALVAPEEQAQAFIEINTRQIRVSGHNILRAALIAGHPWAVASARAVERAGCKLMTSNLSTKDKKPGQVFAVALMRKMIESGHELAITAGLKALLTYDPKSTANFSDALLQPWLGAIAETGRIEHEVLLSVLHKNRPWLVIERASALAKDSGQPLSVTRRRAFEVLIKQEVSA